jgi:tricorn protease
LLSSVFALVWLASPATPQAADGEARLLRFPSIHGDNVAFTYAGNLYTVSAKGGVARRLTNHDGFEMFPRFSPDGKWIAFTGQYDGNTEVYLIPSQGGVPKRLTYTATLGRDDIGDRMGPNNIVIGWKNNGKEILFRSRMATFNDFIGQLYTVSVDGGLPEQLPLPRGGFASYSPDDSKLVYNRIFREFRTWKRYRGGMADEIWIYDFNTKKTEAITKNDASDVIPMWAGDKIYFNSDRDDEKRFNIWSFDLKTKATKQVTQFKDFDVKFPSKGDKAIVFENGGYIYKLDLATEKTEKIAVKIQEDFITGRGGLKDLSKSVNAYEISPDGKRALLGARGELFTVPATNGLTRNLTNSSGVHERNPKWSPDGKTIAFISDSSGEDEIWTVPQDGSDAPKQLTTDADTYKYELFWSPDGKKILWGDKKFRLQYVDVATRKVTQVTQAKAWEIRSYVWSPDSKWITYAQDEVESMDKVYLHSVDQNKSWEVTDGWHNSGDPAFSSDGKYLFFVSQRDFSPIYSTTEWNHAYRDMAKIYFVTLAKETANPFKPKLDEVNEPAPAPAPKVDPAAPIKVDVDGIKERILALPIAAGNYRNLQSAGGFLYYIRTSSREPGSFLAAFDLSGPREIQLGSVNGFEISHDQKKMLVSKGGQYGIIDLPKSGSVEISKPLNLSGVEMRLDRQAEWKQIYNECWRQMRDFFYDPGLHGVDWPAIKTKYAALVPHVQHRADLTYIIGEMIAELNAGHAYVGGGDVPSVPRTPMGLLGAQLKKHPETRYYQIAKILKGASWDRALRSPLTEMGVDVKEGEYIVAINGQPTNEVGNIYELLINTVGKPISLKVNSVPNARGAREVIVTPTGDESQLYYHDWVQGNIKKVNDATGGKVGYLHVPDMQQTGLNEFVKHYYPQLSKKALIIDMRGNGGGNVSPMLIERLRREIAMVGIARNSVPTISPTATFYGPMVCLLNEFSASDGDLFPWQFKHYKLGPLIGKRSWGGVVGIRGSLPIVDGGTLNRPEFSRYDVEGKKWIIEGYGVDPDIEQDNDPAKEFAGTDEQLLKGISVILEKLKTEEKKLPDVPPFPKR